MRRAYRECYTGWNGSFLRPVEYSYRSFAGNLLGCPRCPKRQPVAEVGGDQIHLVRTISKVGGDASHGSHGVVAIGTGVSLEEEEKRRLRWEGFVEKGSFKPGVRERGGSGWKRGVMDGVYRLLYGRRPRLPLHERLVKYQRLPSSRTRRYHRERKCAENYKKNDIIFFLS